MRSFNVLCNCLLRFWRGLYCRYESGIHPRESILDTVCSIKDHTSSLESHKKLVEKVNLENDRVNDVDPWKSTKSYYKFGCNTNINAYRTSPAIMCYKLWRHVSCFVLQRLSSLCKLLGRGEDSLKRTVQNLSSSESLDFRSVLFNDSANASNIAQGATSTPAPAVSANGSASLLNVEENNHGDPLTRKESDSESGFEDGSSSQMSRSLVEDGGPLARLSESDSIDCLQVSLSKSDCLCAA